MLLLNVFFLWLVSLMDGLLPLERRQLHSALKRWRFGVSVAHALKLGHFPFSCSPRACVRPHVPQQGDEIVTQGAVSSNFYMIEEGICEVSISYADDETGEQKKQLEKKTKTSGAFFLASMAATLRPASAKPQAIRPRVLTQHSLVSTAVLL